MSSRQGRYQHLANATARMNTEFISVMQNNLHIIALITFMCEWSSNKDLIVCIFFVVYTATERQEKKKKTLSAMKQHILLSLRRPAHGKQ